MAFISPLDWYPLSFSARLPGIPQQTVGALWKIRFVGDKQEPLSVSAVSDGTNACITSYDN